MRRRSILAVLAVVALIAATVACGTEQDAAERVQGEGTVTVGDLISYEGPSTPKDSEWLLQSLNGGGAAEGSDITLFHDKAELGVEGGCMGFYLVHKLEDDRIRAVEPGLQSGRVDCGKPQGVQRQAEEILGIMRNLEHVRATEDRFELRGASGGVAVFVPPAPVQLDPALAGTEWFLTLLHGKEPLPKPQLTLEIDVDGVGGFSGCNSFGGAIDKMDEGTLTWSSGPSHGFASTLVGCGEPEEPQEMAYQDAVAGAQAYRLDGDRLELRDARGRTTVVLREKTRSSFDPAELENTRWRVRSVNGESPGEGSVPTVEFGSGGQIAWYDGCLQHSGTYRFTDYELVASRGGPMQGECMKPGTPGNFYPGGNYRMQNGLLEILYQADGTKTILEPLARDAELNRSGPPWELGAFVENGATTHVSGGVPITLTFDRGTLRREGEIHGSTGCNDYRAAYTYPTVRNTFERIVVADPVTYPHECRGSRALSEEKRFLAILGNLGNHPSISTSGQLVLETKDGRKLVFPARE